MKDIRKIDNEHIVIDGVTYKLIEEEKEPQLPRTWEEYCKEEYSTQRRYFINDVSYVIGSEDCFVPIDPKKDKNLLPNKETAEAVLALCQLIQLRECYNQGWKPDWSDGNTKFLIDFEDGEIRLNHWYSCAYSPLFFKTEELSGLFLKNFRDLIEKLKPLYGIKTDNQP